MPKTTELYVCSHCDAQSPKWQGRCPECGKWGTLEKTTPTIDIPNRSAAMAQVAPGSVINFQQVVSGDVARFSTALDECDRVLGGGIVPGSLILLGGEPGIGKSTIVLQIAQGIGKPTLYVSGEESAQQIKTRVDRLSINAGNLQFLGETNVETIVATIIKHKPTLAIIDSIQTIYSAESPTGPGSINQVRLCTTKLLEAAKSANVAIIIIGHVTKGGEVAGPKTLEHLVDVVMYIEGDNYHALRLLRGTKNRFGSTSEVGVFEMTAKGLIKVADPTAVFLFQHSPIPGSVVTATLEGSRVFLVEVQALTTPTTFGYPQRRAEGFDLNRLQLLIATIGRRASIQLAAHDVFVNIAGGLKVDEPAIDLAVCMALASALQNKAVSHDTIVLGEIGLGGEIRPIQQLNIRLKEAEKLGFKKAIIPVTKERIEAKKITVNAVASLTEALALL